MTTRRPASTPRPTRAALALAVLVPVLVFGWGALRLQRTPKATGRAAVFERKLRSHQTDVLVLGSSLARTNVRTDQLADELGIPRRNVVMLTLPNATAAHWYAILRNRVYANGHEPRLVIMVGALTTMVTPDILMDTNVERLMNQLTDDEPVIGAKVLGTNSPAMFRYLFMRERAGAIRDDALTSYRDWAIAWLFGDKGKPSEGRRLAERANEVVFADEKMDYALHTRSSTGLYDGAVEELDLTGLDVARESLIPDIGALAAEHGTAVAFVRTPFPPSNADNDLVDPAVEAEAAQVMADAGSAYLDLRSLNLDDSYFQDMRHMSREGATIFTAALAESLRAMRALSSEGDVGAVSLGLEPLDVTRLGTPPSFPVDAARAERSGRCGWMSTFGRPVGPHDEALAAAGHRGATPFEVTWKGEPLPRATEGGCEPAWSLSAEGLRTTLGKPKNKPAQVEVHLSDEVPMEVPGEELPAYWVYPGTTLRFTFDQPWPHDPEDFRLFLLGHVFGPDRLGQPVVRVGSEESALQVLGMRGWLSRPYEVPQGEGPWTLDVEVPEDGPWLLIQNLAVGDAPHTSHVVGLPELLTGASIRVVGGKVEDTELDPVYLNDPPPIPQPSPRPAPRDLAMFTLPAFSALADAPHARAVIPHKCSPLRILEDGEPLAEHHAVCLDMANLKAGRSCHAGRLLYFSASDGTNPLKNGRDYSLTLDPSRVCDRRNQRALTPLRGVLWLYPGDHLVLDLPKDQLATFYDGANKLEIEVEAPAHGQRDGLDVRLFVEGEAVIDQRLKPPIARRRTKGFLLEPALPPRVDDVRLEVVNPSKHAYWLLLRATLSEEYEYGFGPESVLDAADGDDEAEDTDALDTDLSEEAAAYDMFGDQGADPFGDGEAALVSPPDAFDQVTSVAAWERVGDVPETPPLRDTKEARPGILEGHAFALWPISNSVLAKKGYGWWSPLRVYDHGAELPPAKSRRDLRSDCERCFLHLGQSVIVRVDDAENPALAIDIDPALPLVTPNGAEVPWVFPGGGVRARFDTPWSGQAALAVRLDTFTTEKNEGWSPPTLTVGDQTVPFVPTGEAWLATLTLPADEARRDWSLQVDIDKGGPSAVLLEAWLEDDRGVTSLLQPPSGAEATPASP